MLHRLCGPPSIPLSFSLAAVVLRRHTYRVSLSPNQVDCLRLSVQCLGRGLQGYLIPFAPHAFVHERQLWFSKLPAQSEFLVISKHFTATPQIPPTSSILKNASFEGTFTVKLQNFTADLISRLRTL